MITPDIPRINEKKSFGCLTSAGLTLRQFFNRILSRKAEGDGPMKP
jgi:hypothetical protein